VLYPLSYTGVIPVAGFEPATTRVRGEVTLVFTTGRFRDICSSSSHRGTLEKSSRTIFSGTCYFEATPSSRKLSNSARAPAPHVFWPGNSRTRQGLRPEDSNLTTHLRELFAKEVSVTNHHWPCVVRAGGIYGGGVSSASRRNRSLRHPACFVLLGLREREVSN
jgi:hypothetical protein